MKRKIIGLIVLWGLSAASAAEVKPLFGEELSTVTGQQGLFFDGSGQRAVEAVNAAGVAADGAEGLRLTIPAAAATDQPVPVGLPLLTPAFERSDNTNRRLAIPLGGFLSPAAIGLSNLPQSQNSE